MSVPNKAAEDVAHGLLCSVSDLVQPEDPVITVRVADLTPEMLHAIGKKQTNEITPPKRSANLSGVKGRMNEQHGKYITGNLHRK
jgi:hypothetical protein